MSASLHARCPATGQCDQRSGFGQARHPATLSHLQQQPQRLLDARRRLFPSPRRHASSGRREVLLTTALLTIPTTRSDISSSQLPPLSSAAESSRYDFEGDTSVSEDEDDTPPTSCRPQAPPFRVTAPGRIVAVGDIHGDLAKAITLFKLAGVVEEVDRRLIWIGGDTTVVQLGDVLDRGAQEIASLQLLRNLDQQARQEGGAVYMINGNHESLNVAGDFRYATEGGMLESATMGGLRGVEAHMSPNQRAARLRLFSPGGHLAKELAHNATVLIVNDTMFAHGGVLMGHVQYGLERINLEVSAWMRGDRLGDGSRAPPPFLAMGDRKSIMWNRTFSQDFGTFHARYHACNELRQVLQRTGCKRLIVGHTPQQQGMNAECEGLVWRVDVGMSSGVLDAQPQALEISPARPQVGEEASIKVLGAPEDPLACFQQVQCKSHIVKKTSLAVDFMSKLGM
mmetsp:Transcript_14506/g.43844  ORF Transcript_14506/g.43844 Transcript_14506/m.43844 type:complete len:455 (-) Transcript_14506:505-1869(-)